MATLDEMLARFAKFTPAEQADAVKTAERLTGGMKWIPNPGPQTEAVHCKADVLFFGGQGGGTKTELLLGLAFMHHRRSLIVRRRYSDLSAITERAIEINGTRDGYNGSPPPKLRTTDGRLIEFGAAQHPGSEQAFQGQPHDLFGADEAVQFLESQIRFFMGWVRSTTPGQRVRSVLVSNAPINAEQRWIIGMFRPWLDLTHPKPAKPGELRWYVKAPDGSDLEVDGPTPVEIDGKTLIPLSRTFIPAALSDNPFLSKTNYQAQLDALEEPIRSAVRDGDFAAAQQDAEGQVIPTAWIIAAERRWVADGARRNGGMTAMSFDSAGGGKDAAVLAVRHGPWVGELVTERGPQTADGALMAALIVKNRRDNCPVVMDVGGGFASGAILRLKDNGIEPHKFDGGKASPGAVKGTGQRFANKRAEIYMRLKEELDPDQPGGAVLALPPDPELRSDLATHTAKLTLRGWLVEAKEEIRKKLGRSPGKGDAVAMVVAEGQRAAQRQGGSLPGGRKPKINMGHNAARRR